MLVLQREATRGFSGPQFQVEGMPYEVLQNLPVGRVLGPRSLLLAAAATAIGTSLAGDNDSA